MPHIAFTPNLERYMACPAGDVPGDTVRGVLETVFSQNTKLRGYLLDDQGRLRKHVNIFVNETMVSDRKGLTDPVRGTDRIFVIQSLSGG